MNGALTYAAFPAGPAIPCERAVEAAIACPPTDVNGTWTEWATMVRDEKSAAREPIKVAYSPATT